MLSNVNKLRFLLLHQEVSLFNLANTALKISKRLISLKSENNKILW